MLTNQPLAELQRLTTHGARRVNELSLKTHHFVVQQAWFSQSFQMDDGCA